MPVLIASHPRKPKCSTYQPPYLITDFIIDCIYSKFIEYNFKVTHGGHISISTSHN